MNDRFQKIKSPLTCILLLVVIPVIVILGAAVFRAKYYAYLSLCVAVISCIPIFYCFERKEASSKELIVLAVMTAVSVVGRFVFAWLPGFKPVTAITVITAIYLGREAGFLVGSLSAVLSNMYFGQGPWTPFQMFAWGFLGFLAGALAKPLKQNRVFLCLYGALSGLLFSAVMDIWTTLWAGGDFALSRYFTVMASALPFTVEYAVSNVIFLWLLAKPIGEKLERMQKKYGLFMRGNHEERGL